MNNYYLTLVLKADLTESVRGESLESVKKGLEKLDKEDVWGAKDLSYPIKHNSKGYYVHFEFSSDPSKIISLDNNLKLDENILRYLLIRRDK